MITEITVHASTVVVQHKCNHNCVEDSFFLIFYIFPSERACLPWKRGEKSLVVEILHFPLKTRGEGGERGGDLIKPLGSDNLPC